MKFGVQSDAAAWMIFRPWLVMLTITIWLSSVSKNAEGSTIQHPRQADLSLEISDSNAAMAQSGENKNHAAMSATKTGRMACQPCANGARMFQEMESFESNDTQPECAMLSTKALAIPSAMSQECKLQQLENYQSDCCPTPPRGVCPLCPDGGVFDALTIVPSLSDGSEESRTCADLLVGDMVQDKNGAVVHHFPFLDYLFTPGECSDTLLQRTASWCKCPGKVAECSLCPDGKRSDSSRSARHREKVFYGWDCDAFELVASWFSQNECAHMVKDILEFDAPAFCQCEGSNPPPNLCSLCGDGAADGAVKFPDEILEDGQYTCHDLATSLQFIPNESTCDRLLESYHENGVYDTCCGVDTSVLSVQGHSSDGEQSKPGIFRSSRAWTIASLFAAATLLLFAIWYSCRRRRPAHKFSYDDSFDY